MLYSYMHTVQPACQRFLFDTSPIRLIFVMAKFEFPKNPNADRTNPFEGDDGANPFGDGAAPAEDDQVHDPAQAENVYASGDTGQVQPYLPTDYETFLPNRGRLVWWLGFAGCCIQLLSIVVIIVAVVVTGDNLQGIVYGLPGQLIGLAVSIPAWILGASDAKAIAAGAMEDEGSSANRWGLLLGVVATILGVTQLFGYFGLLLFDQLYG